MKDMSPQRYIPSFLKIGLLILEKIFEGFFFIYGRVSHLDHVTQMARIQFRSPYPRRLHINLALIGKRVSEKKIFEHCGRRWTDSEQTMNSGAWVYYKLTYDPSAQMS